MNPELQKELAQWLASLRETVGNGMNFVIEQAPLVVQEKITFGRAYETTWFIVALFAVVATGILARALLKTRAAREAEERDKEEDGNAGLPTIQASAACVACVVSVILATNQLYFVYLV
jgi:hypothetical protein